jgi:hypothetical protein
MYLFLAMLFITEDSFSTKYTSGGRQTMIYVWLVTCPGAASSWTSHRAGYGDPDCCIATWGCPKGSRHGTHVAWHIVTRRLTRLPVTGLSGIAHSDSGAHIYGTPYVRGPVMGHPWYGTITLQAKFIFMRARTFI